MESRLQVFSVCIAQLLNSPCLSSTLLTGGTIVRFAVVDEVRLSWTSYSWSMEFDIVELWNTAVAEFGVAEFD